MNDYSRHRQIKMSRYLTKEEQQGTNNQQPTFKIQCEGLKRYKLIKNRYFREESTNRRANIHRIDNYK